MKIALVLIISILSLNLFGQDYVQCGEELSKCKGNLVDTSSTQPRMTLTAPTGLKVGATGMLSWLTEDGSFRMTFSIGIVKVIAVTPEQLTFEVPEKLGVMTINGVTKSNFKTGELVQFSEYVYEEVKIIDTKWPSGTTKEKGKEVCGKKIGEWKEYHENGKIKVEYKADDKGEIQGDYNEYHANGTKAVEGKYSFGKKSGLWTEYFETGEIKSQGYYYSGEKSGKWIEHDAAGKKVKKKY